jgi:hypothetical protein
MENSKKITETYEKNIASKLSEKEWADKLFQIKNLLQMIGRRDESIRQYKQIALEKGIPESEFELAINNNLALRADFIEQLVAVFTEFNIPIQSVFMEKALKKSMDLSISQAA